MSNIKITTSDVVGALFDFIALLVRPAILYLVWNYLFAITDDIAKINFLQAVALIIMFYLFSSCIRIVVPDESDEVKSEKKDV